MNALFGTVIKFFLALVQANDALREDDGNRAQWRNGLAGWREFP